MPTPVQRSPPHAALIHQEPARLPRSLQSLRRLARASRYRSPDQRNRDTTRTVADRWPELRLYSSGASGPRPDA